MISESALDTGIINSFHFKNIWTCSVQGQRKTSLLNGHLIRDDKLICSPLQLTTISSN